ncbi:hypothetical protein UR09_02205 [Candidatus Nitromaritima sp. SCGC AAA799-A02]|nr:hypothetical protein UZ36_06450 [Candidatus Nitromaritima sp. SCGC AAA799-C22]KMP11922.1 hypothetical protein UR09_02205 [Candidatus Nitromaritima sp. SCGC AAA799-A02]
MNHKPKIYFFPCAGLLLAFLAGILFAGCATIPEKRLEKERLTLVYKNKSVMGSDLEKLRLEHPIEIAREAVTNHLLSLRYEELSLLGKGRFVFSPDDVIEITPLLTKALNRMSPDNILYYEVDTPRGTTSGTVFRARERLHWRFDSIKGVSFSNNSFPGHRGSTWRLVPKAGQSYGQSKSLFGKNVQENWITATLNLPVKSKRNLRARAQEKPSRRSATSAPEPSRPEPTPANQEELEKRLQLLKDLRDKNLINDSEYERKRKELLDQYL